MSFSRVFLFIFVIGNALVHGEEPWGKDSDLSQISAECSYPSHNIRTPILGPLGEVLIRFHQEVISPADGPRSNYIPSSSQYTLDSMRKYGFFQGFTMGCDRLMRENDEPWVYRETLGGDGKIMKLDPVP